MFTSLKTKLILLVSALLFLGIASVAGLIYVDSLARIEKNLGERALSIARTASTQIDGDTHDRIAKNISGAAAMPEFQAINEQLRKIKAINQLQTDVYTYIKTWWVEQDYISFLASSSTEPFQANKGQDMQEENRIPLIEGRDGYSEIVTNINGEWITGFAPIKTSNGAVSGVVEVALNTSEEVAAAKMEFLTSTAIAALLALLVGVFLTFLVSSSIASPVQRLIGVTQKMAGGDLKVRAQIAGRDEIARLGQDFNVMAGNLEKSYKELEDYSKNLEKMVEERTAEVVASRKKIQKILEHIEQGILTFDASLAIDSEFSAFLPRFYNTPARDLAGRNVVDFIFPEADLSADEMSQTKETLNAVVGESSIAWDFNSDHLPTEVNIAIGGERKIIALEWTPIVDEADEVERLMLAIRDLTAQRILEQKMAEDQAKNEKMMIIIGEIIAHRRGSVGKFLADAGERLQNVATNLKGEVDAAAGFRDLHTIKGGSRLLKFRAVMDRAHLAEEPFQQLQRGEREVPASELRENVEALQQELAAYRDVFDNVLGSSGEGQSSEGDVLPTVVGTQILGLRKTITDSGCRLGSLSCNDAVVDWDGRVLPELGNIIMHGLNNSIDHGYLRPRKRGGKVSEIDLAVEARLDGHDVVIDVKDRGVGFDLERIKKAAAERGVATGDSEGDILASLFSDGVSTAEEVSESSGRGVGLPAVKEMVTKLGGHVQLRPNEPQGAHLIVTLPQTSVLPQAEKRRTA